MGEMNENAIQPQLESVVEQPNNQLGEQQTETIIPSQEATGAVVEEPKPIVEQQIALDVNVEDVFAGGTTKEDEITQIVTDAVKNAEESLIEEPIPTGIQPPVVEPPVVEVPLLEVPTVEVPVSEPIAETTITEAPVQTEEDPAPAVEPSTPEVPVVEQPVVEVPVPEVPAVEAPIAETVSTEPVVTLEPGPLSEEQDLSAMAAPMDIAAPAVDIPTPEVPAVEQPVVEVPLPEVPVAEVPVPEVVPTEPVATLEPGPASEIQDLSAPASPMDIAVPAVDIPTPDVPAVEQPAVETSLPEVPAVEIPSAEVAVVEQPMDMAPMTDFQQAEAAPLIEVPQNIEQPVAMEQPVVELQPEVPTQPVDMATQIMPDIENTQILTDNMSPISEIPVPEIPVPETTLPDVPVAEEVPTEPVVTLEPGPVIEEQNPMAELAIPQPEPIPDPVSDFAQSINNPEVNLFAQNPSGLTIENIQATMQQQELSQNGESFVGIPAELANQSDVPTPVTDEVIPVGSEPPKTEESENEETKTIIHQSAPLGKVQPVAPISVYTQQTGSILPTEEPADETDNTATEETDVEETSESVVEVNQTTKDTEEPAIEVSSEEEQKEETSNEDSNPESEKVIAPMVTDETSIAEEGQVEDGYDDDKDKKSINIKDLDDIAIKVLEEETKEAEVSTKQKHKVNIEDELYVEIDEAEAPKQSRNNKRKMIKGREKFKSNQKIVPLEEEPIIRFCKSCGNVVSKEKVVCENCGEPV